MPLTSHTTDSLPYIDRPPSPASLAAATTLINSSLPPPSSSSSRPQPLHPSLPPAPTPSFTPLLLTEMNRLSAATTTADSSSSIKVRHQQQGGVDLSRYSAVPTLPPPPPPTSTSTSPPEVRQQQQEEEEAAKAALEQSCINATYLRLRNEQLGLLERYGRNAWLVGNDTLEEILREKEKGLVETRAAVEEVNRGRKAGQLERGGGEDGVEGLERRWREGVGRGVEVGVAVREVEGRIREG